jgi:magnesium and cobalt transporter
VCATIVSEPSSSSAQYTGQGANAQPAQSDKRSLFQKIAEFLNPGPDSKDELFETLADAEDNDVIGAQSRAMLEGVIRMADMSAGDVMVPVSRIDLLDIDSTMDELMHQVIRTAHSRFPVYEGEKDNILGILMAKDLLKLQRAPAIVIDEFGRMAGLLTIEDVLEEIVGEIEDEFDIVADEGDIFGLADKTYRVSGDTAIERVNDAFKVTLLESDSDNQFDTIGGLVAHEMGHVPKRGESMVLNGLSFTVLHTKGGAVKWFKVMPEHMAE